MAIRWETLTPKQVEDLLSSLVNLLHPNRAQRIDGSGGDGGRDVQVGLEDGDHLYEIKSHTGRMRNTRRRQVEASLARAALLSPKSWTLLVPVDPNPTEEKWFRRLRETTPFPIAWRGRTWLDTELAKRPFLERYWLHGTADELRHLLELANQEQAGLLNGAVDAAERSRKIAALLNESNPFWRFEITTDGEATTMRPSPRYRGAERDFPITFNVTFSFPKTPEAEAVADELRSAFDFGTPARVPSEYIREVTVDAPIPLVPSEGARSIEIGPADGPRQSIPMILGIVTPAGSSLGEIPVTLEVISRGERGAKLAGTDRSGIVGIQLTLDRTELRATGNITITHPKSAYYANEVRDPIRVLKHAVAPNLIQFRSADGHMVSSGIVPFDESPVEDRFDEFLDDLVAIQWASGLNRPVGPTFNAREVGEVTEAAKLLRGETLVGTWNDFHLTLAGTASDELRRDFTRGPKAMRIVTRRPQIVEVTGTAYPVGEAIEHTFPSVVLAPEHRDAADGIPVEVPVRFVPGNSNEVSRRLVKGGDLESDMEDASDADPA